MRTIKIAFIALFCLIGFIITLAVLGSIHVSVGTAILVGIAAIIINQRWRR